MPPSLSTLLTALAALAGVVALVLAAGRLVRRAGWARAPGAQRLRVIDTLPLDRARRLCIVRCDGRDLVLLTGGGNDTVVGWLPARDGDPA